MCQQCIDDILPQMVKWGRVRPCRHRLTDCRRFGNFPYVWLELSVLEGVESLLNGIPDSECLLVVQKYGMIDDTEGPQQIH